MIFAGTMAGGRLLVAKLSEKINLKIIMICSAFLGVGVSFVIPFASNIVWFYILMAFAGLSAGCFWPSTLSEASNCLKINPTMLFVMLSCIGIVGFGLTPWVMGVIGDYASLKISFFIIPSFFAILVLLFALEWRMTRK